MKKSKAISLEKSSIFKKIFVLEANLLACVWLERGRIAFTVDGKDFFLTKNHCRRGTNFRQKMKAIAIEKSSIFKFFCFLEANLLASVWLKIGSKDIFLIKNHCRRGSDF